MLAVYRLPCSCPDLWQDCMIAIIEDIFHYELLQGIMQVHTPAADMLCGLVVLGPNIVP